MSELALIENTIPAMSDDDIAAVRRLEAASLARPQRAIATTHAFHAGMYARTLTIPTGVLLTGALIKIPTVLIVSGHCLFYLDGAPREMVGYHVLTASSGRKSAFLALADTHLTMLFATDAKTVEDAERQFTDEHELLFSRNDDAENLTIAGGG